MKRSYVIVLAACAAIFVFAVGFYLTGGDDAGPPRPAAGAGDGDRPGDARTRLSDADADVARRDPAASPAPPRSSSRDLDHEAATDLRTRRTRSTLDAIRASVEAANADREDADAPAAASTDTDTDAAADPPTRRSAPTRSTGLTPPFEPDGSEPAGATGGIGTANATAGGADPDAADPTTQSRADDDPEPAAATEAAADPSASTRAADAQGSPPGGDADADAMPRRAEAADRPANYTIQPGDTLEAIAINLYGDARYWDEIAQANPLLDPLKMQVGDEIRLPADLDEPDTGEPEIAAPGDVVRYTVRPGDTLSTIARQYYNRASRWRYLYNVNRQVIGPNPNRLQAGDVLTVPPYPEPAE